VKYERREVQRVALRRNLTRLLAREGVSGGSLMSAITKAAVFGVSGYLAAVVSVTLAYWLLAFEVFAYFLYNFGPPMGRTWRSVVFALTQQFPAVLVTVCIVSAALAGGFGYWAALRSRREGGSRLAASATRLALAGLAGVALDLIIVASMVAYIRFA
jgi:hypothetical protein